MFQLEDAQTGKRIPYGIVHSQRRTISIQITRDGEVVVRCPLGVSDKKAREFVESHRDWLEIHYARAQARKSTQPVMTEEEVQQYRARARSVLTERTRFWAEKMGVSYGRITIRQQVTRWGSCSAKGNLNFNWTLILVPEDLLDYVVVHELAHRIEMNHSERFWKLVKAQLPDYQERRMRLRQYENQVEIRPVSDR